MIKKIDVESIIEHLGLQALPREGGLFIQSYRSADILSTEQLPDRYTTSKPAGTAIYYFLTDHEDSFSAIHRLPTDEIYHFYLGDEVELLLLYPNGDSRVVILGQDICNGQVVQFVVPRGVWQGSRLLPGGEYALLGTTMAPGWTDEDYEEASQAQLVAGYPAQAELIQRLTRN